MAAHIPNPLLDAALRQIICQCNQLSKYLRSMENDTGYTPRCWMGPHPQTDTEGHAWDGSLFELEKMHAPFDRKVSAKEYEEAYKLPEKTIPRNVTMARKMEMDYLSMLERSFRARHQTPIRALMHTAGRRLAHGTSGTSVLDSVRGLIADRFVG